MKAWIETYAAHVRKRFGSRARLRARVMGAEPVDVCQLYGLEGGGLIVVAWCGHDEECTGEHGHAHDDAHAHDEGHAHGHRHGDADHPCQHELWVSSPEQVVFEARPAEAGELCTGFGYLGVSRTPQILVPRGTEPPPKKGHEHGDF